MVNEYTKQVMYDAIAHHLLTKPVLKQLPLPANSPSFIVASYGLEYLFGQFG